MFLLKLSGIALLCSSLVTAQKCAGANNNSKYFIPLDNKVSHLDASKACNNLKGTLVDVNHNNYAGIKSVMDKCFPKGVQVWIRSFNSPNNTPKCMRIPSGPGPIKDAITFNCNDKTYPMCVQT